MQAAESIPIYADRAYYVGGKEANCLHMEVGGGNFPSLGGGFY